ncbi:MAG: cysteine hydrolase [Candidatus Kuenenia sp.]|nr:cysteine hydrolase [Candidatus Kuenenia hertensis]
MIKKAKRNDVNTALLICDMLNDFVKKEAPLEVPAARDIVPGIKKQIQLARKSCIPVIYCCDAHKSNDPEFSLWPRHAVKGTEGACIVKQLEPEKDDYIVHKTNYSCFYKTSLQTLLKQLGTTHLILTGVVTNICILYTVAEAYMRGYTTTIPGDCVAALTQKDHKYALQQMKRVFNAKIL